MKSSTRNLFRLSCLAALPLLVSCTTVIKAPPRATQYVTDKKIPLKIALNITDELRQAKWEQKALTGGGTAMAVGTALAEDAPQFARSTFADVIEVNNGAAPTQPVDAILTPRMAFIGITYGQTMFSKDTITLKLEWTLASSAGNVLWADTITGLGVSKGGFAKDLKLAIEDAFRKTQDTMLSAPALQQLASRK
jgi:hypothetical protein